MNTATKIEQIKDVALYLRKSRGIEDDLDKHKQDLIDLCKENNWRYTEFAEVGSSADIEYRPQLQQMLEDIKSDLFDAVVVIDKDRLSREGMGQAVINQTLIDNDCLIVTPSKIYDLSNDNDVLMSEVEDLMARFEYRMIKKRLRRGKIRGNKDGNWTNGIPPFPYIYSVEKKGLVLKEENVKWYRFMVDNFIQGKPLSYISVELNKMGVKTKNGNYWHDNSIRRLLVDQTHLGHIISNKSEGSGHLNRKVKQLKYFPKEEWYVVENCHESIKTQQEHDEIMSQLSKNRRIANTTKQIKLPLTSIIKCGLCGKTMQVWQRDLVGGVAIYIKQCNKPDPFGNRCKNGGGNSEGVNTEILNAIKSYRDKYKSMLEETNSEESNDTSYLEMKIMNCDTQINKKKESINRIDLAFEEGLYDVDKYKSRLSNVRNEIEKLKNEKSSFEHDKTKLLNRDVESKHNEYKKTVDDIESGRLNWKQLNELYKVMGVEVTWTKKGKGITPDVIVDFTK